MIAILVRRRPDRELAQELLQQALVNANDNKGSDITRVIGEIRNSFTSLAAEALGANNETFLSLAETKLDAKNSEAEGAIEGKRKLIDAKIQSMTNRLGELDTILQRYRDERNKSFGQLAGQLAYNTQAVAELHGTTSHLAQALASTRKRGEWGERMADDILRLAGLIEGTNYHKHQRTEAGEFPDYTFLLPQSLSVHMDVKFPLENYRAFLEAADDTTRAQSRKQFLRDVRNRISEVGAKSYIDPANGTIDCAIAFVPNEQVFASIHEFDNSIMDDALKCKVILCSPHTLFAVLAIVRQAADNFQLQRATSEILSLLGEFEKQWKLYKEELNKVRRQMNSVVNTFDTLETTRTNQLERPLRKVDAIRQQELHVSSELSVDAQELHQVLDSVHPDNEDNISQ